MTSKILKASEYAEAFDLGKIGTSGGATDKLKAALEHAKDNRKFEIDLYWKRAAYFWTLIAAAFAGYFVLLGGVNIGDEKRLLAFAISCIGFVFTFAWFLVNRGSKQWQENWENHVDMLENKITGPLYKTVMRRPSDSDNGFIAKHVTGPGDFSVSKINQLINVYTMLIWALLCFHVSNVYPHPGAPDVERIGMLLAGSAFCVIIWFFGQTHVGNHHHVAYIRQTEVLDATSLKAAGRPIDAHTF